MNWKQLFCRHHGWLSIVFKGKDNALFIDKDNRKIYFLYTCIKCGKKTWNTVTPTDDTLGRN